MGKEEKKCTELASISEAIRFVQDKIDNIPSENDYERGQDFAYYEIKTYLKSIEETTASPSIVDNKTFPYLKSEQDFQIIAMKALGINYPENGVTFEQCVNTVLMLAKKPQPIE